MISMHYWSFLLLIILPQLALTDAFKFGHIRDAEFPPYTWEDSVTHQVHGYNEELVGMVMAELGLETENYFYGNEYLWDVRPTAADLKTGTLDMYFMAADTAEPYDHIYVIPYPFITVQVRIFTHKDKQFVFEQWSDLKNRTGIDRLNSGGLIAGSLAFDRYARSELNIVLVDTIEEMVAAVENGTADYMITVYRPTLLELRLNNLQEVIVPLPKNVLTVPLYWVVSKQSPLMDKTSQIEALLRKYEQEGRSQFLMRQEMLRYLQLQGTAP